MDYKQFDEKIDELVKSAMDDEDAFMHFQMILNKTLDAFTYYLQKTESHMTNEKLKELINKNIDTLWFGERE